VSDSSAARPPEQSTEHVDAHRDGSWWIGLLWAILLALTIRHFLFQAYKIPSGSMIPTLLVGDQLIASKISYGIRLPLFNEKLAKFGVPERGEIIVFRYPEDPSKDFIKRAIGLPGDRVRIDAGMIYINDKPVERTRLGEFRYKDPKGGTTTAMAYRETLGDYTYRVLYSRHNIHTAYNMPEITLGPEEIFAMGDNRDRSNDSRAWGPVDLDLLEGKPLVIHFSWNSLDNGVRWDRIGTGIN